MTSWGSSHRELLPTEPKEYTSYDIPLESWSPEPRDPSYEDLAHIGTTNFIHESLQEAESRRDNSYHNFNFHPVFDDFLKEDCSTTTTTSTLSHGFFLGKGSVQDLSLPKGASANGFEDDEDDTEDEGIHEIYRPNRDPNTWTRQSDRSYKSSPETTPRNALSQRIGNIGGYSQNIGLGHKLGVHTEDATLIPRRVKFCSSQFVIREDTPVQVDVHWSKPDNASNFANFIYKIEVCLPENGDNWVHVTQVRWPTFRIYHTEDKLLIGKHRVIRRDDDTTIKLRIRGHGELVLPDRVCHWTMSSYSKPVEVTFIGYTPHTPTPDEAQQTHL